MLAGLEDTGPFDELRAAYNSVRGKDETKALPHEKCSMIGFCDFIF